MSRGPSCVVANVPSMGGVFRVAPPVTVSVDEIKEGLRIFKETFDYVLENHGSKSKTRIYSTRFRLRLMALSIKSLNSSLFP